MFLINSSKMQPNHGALFNMLDACMRRGIRVSAELLPEIESERAAVLARLRECGIASPYNQEQLASYFRSLNSWALAAELFDLTSMQWRVDAESLSVVDGDYGAAANAVRDIAEFRSLDGLLRILRKVRERSDRDDLVHPKLSVAGTGRITLSDPALISVPKAYRSRIIIHPEGCRLVSVDIKSQEPMIAFNWFGSDEFRSELETCGDLYVKLLSDVAGVEVAAYYGFTDLPEEKRVTPCLPCYVLNGAMAQSVDNVSLSADKPLPQNANLRLDSGASVKLPVSWGMPSVSTGIKQVRGKVDISRFSFVVAAELRNEVKKCVMESLYGASKSALSDGLLGEYGVLLAKRIRSVLTERKKELTSSYFGSPISAEQRTLFQRSIQATGADILAFLVEHFNANTAALNGVELYYTRHDELVFSVKERLLTDGGAAITERLSELFTHKVDDWLPFEVKVKIGE